MKKIIFLILLFFVSFISFGQVYQEMPQYGYRANRMAFDSSLIIPTTCGVPTLRTNLTKKAAIAFDSCNNRFYQYNPKTSTWSIIGGGSDTFNLQQVLNKGNTATQSGGTNSISLSDNSGYVSYLSSTGLQPVNNNNYSYGSYFAGNFYLHDGTSQNMTGGLADNGSFLDVANVYGNKINLTSEQTTNVPYLSWFNNQYGITQKLLPQYNVSGTDIYMPYANPVDTLATLFDVRNNVPATPNLQQVTDAGIYTTNDMVLTTGYGVGDYSQIQLVNSAANGGGSVYVNSYYNNYLSLNADTIGNHQPYIQWLENTGPNVQVLRPQNAVGSSEIYMPYVNAVDTLATLSDIRSNKIDTTNKFVNQIYRTAGVDSIYYKIGSTVYAIKDSVGTGGGQSGRFGNDTATIVMAKVHNDAGVTLTNGKVVAFSTSGTSSDAPSVKLANNKADSTSATTFGFVSGTIAVNDTGWVILLGKIEKLNTSSFANGDIIYLDSISGQYTKNKPQAPYHLVYLGTVVKANAGNGSIYAKVQNGYEISELHDVKITSPINNQVLAYSDTQQLWKNRNIYSIVDTTATVATKSNVALKLNISDTASMLNTYLRKIDTTNKFVNTITRTAGKDSIIFYIGGTRYAIKDSTGGGGGSAAGSTGYVQFNSAGAFAADSSLFWDNTNKRLGIGTTTPTRTFQVLGNASISTTLKDTIAGAVTGTSIVGNISPVTNSAAQFRALNMSNLWNAPGINFSTESHSIWAENRILNIGNFSGANLTGIHSYGAWFPASNNTCGTLNTVIGIKSYPYSNNSLSPFSGTITNAVGAYIGIGNLGTGLTVTNQAGIVIENYATAVNNTNLLIGTSTIPSGGWSLYNAGSNKNYFNGNTLIGTTTDAGYKLDVNGTARVVTSLQTPQINGNTTSGGTLTLQSTTNATKGKILFGTSAYDEVNNRLGIGTASPSYNLDVNGTARVQGALNFNPTNTAAGTTGNQTINKPSGTVNIAAGGTTITVTNSLVTTSSIVFAVIRTNDATAVIKNVVPGAGSFDINLNAAATAETSIGFFVIN